MPVALPQRSDIALRESRRLAISDPTVALLFALVPVLAVAVSMYVVGFDRVATYVALLQP